MAGLRPTGIEYPVGSGTYINIERDTSAYQAIFLADQTYSVTVTQTMESRRNATGLLTSISVDGRTIPMTIIRDRTSAVTSAQFHDNVKRWFDPGKGRSGTRYLRVLGDDGTTALRLPVHVVYLAPRPSTIDVYDVQLQAVTPYFEALTETSTVITTSGTVTNSGNARAQATLEITGGTSISGNKYTITDTSGRGIINYPFVILDVAPTNQANSFVLVGGTSVAFRQGATGAYYWIFIDLPASGSVTVDILRNTGLTNPLAGTLQMGDLNTASTSNTTQDWTFFSETAGGRSGMWNLETVKLDTWGEFSPTLYNATIETSAKFQFTTTSANTYNMAGTAMALVPGADGQVITNLSRVTQNFVGRMFVRYRTQGSSAWQVGWVNPAFVGTSNVTVTTSISVPNATEIIAGFEPIITAEAAGTATFSWVSGAGSMTLTGVPTRSTATATTWRILNGTITNTTNGQTVTFTNLIRRTGTLTIATTSDYNQRRIQNSVSGPMLGDVSFSDSVDLFSIGPGPNSVTETIDGSVTIKHRRAVL